MSAASSSFHQARQATQEALWLAAHIQFFSKGKYDGQRRGVGPAAQDRRSGSFAGLSGHWTAAAIGESRR